MLQVFLLIFSLSIDSLMAGFSLGVSQIHISWKYLILLNGLSACLLFLSVLFGNYFSNLISNSFAHCFSIILFLCLGIGKIMESIFHRLMNKEKEFKIKISKIECIFHIYVNPEASDMDFSKQISCREAFWLGLALSLDNLAIGIGIGLINISSILVTICSFLIGVFLITSGHFIGLCIGKKRKLESSWISGILLIILAFLK